MKKIDLDALKTVLGGYEQLPADPRSPDPYLNVQPSHTGSGFMARGGEIGAKLAPDGQQDFGNYVGSQIGGAVFDQLYPPRPGCYDWKYNVRTCN